MVRLLTINVYKELVFNLTKDHHVGNTMDSEKRKRALTRLRQQRYRAGTKKRKVIKVNSEVAETQLPFQRENSPAESIERSECALDSSNELRNTVLDIDSESDQHDEVEKLRQWAVTSGIPHVKLDELLQILRKRLLPELPKSSKTFLKTSSAEYSIQKFGNKSEFVYFGVASYLKTNINIACHKEDNVELLINIDGIPLFASSSKQFWPILGMIYHKVIPYKPFPIAIYVGDQKPSDVNKYLEQFLLEMNTLQSDGIVISKKLFKISIKAFICDRPARSFIKNVKNHGGYFACERCEVKGERVDGRTVYLETSSPLRNHQNFIEQSNQEHHTGLSPLLALNNCDMIKMFLLDFMHLTCLGIMKKMLCNFWLDAKSARKLNTTKKLLLSDQLLDLQNKTPCEFQRTTRDISDISKWKATEFRFFLLYAGPVVLKSCLQDDLYEHFLLFSVACRILSSNLAVKCSTHARRYLLRFVEIAQKLYGSKSIILNMHSLIHLTDDVEFLGDAISRFTAFPFENALGKIKKKLRTGKSPLAQVCRRLYEQAGIIDAGQNLMNSTPMIEGKKSVDSEGKTIIKKIKFASFTISAREGDNTVLLKDNNIMEISEIFILPEEGAIKISGFMFKKLRPMLTFPCDSVALEMWKVEKDEKKLIFRKIGEVKKKMVILVSKEGGNKKLYAMPLLHC